MSAPSRQSVSGETPLQPTLPLRLGRFILCIELGAGGMATVYLARMRLAAGFERLVALKTHPPAPGEGEAFVDMFLDEAAHRLAHQPPECLRGLRLRRRWAARTTSRWSTSSASRSHERDQRAGRAAPTT